LSANSSWVRPAAARRNLICFPKLASPDVTFAPLGVIVTAAT
jgi:hypothetical protein